MERADTIWCYIPLFESFKATTQTLNIKVRDPSNEETKLTYCRESDDLKFIEKMFSFEGKIRLFVAVMTCLA